MLDDGGTRDGGEPLFGGSGAVSVIDGTAYLLACENTGPFEQQCRIARVPASRTNCFGMVTVASGPMPSASVAAREPDPTSTRSGGGVRRVVPESRGRKIPGTSPRAVWTMAGCASNSEG